MAYLVVKDVKELLARDMQSAHGKREQVRRDFPWCTNFSDSFRAVFGDDVKARHFVENGKEIGKPVDNGNMDAFRMLDFIDAMGKMKLSNKRGKK